MSYTYRSLYVFDEKKKEVLGSYLGFRGTAFTALTALLEYRVKIRYKEKSQNYIDACRRFSGGHESTERFLFIAHFYGSFIILPILMELNDTHLIFLVFTYFTETQLSTLQVEGVKLVDRFTYFTKTQLSTLEVERA